MKIIFMLAAGAALFLAGCSAPTDSTTYSDQLVVSAFLIGGHPIDSMYVQRTGKVTELYTDETGAVSNAVVVITGNNFSDTLIQDPTKLGRYKSQNRSNIIRPGASYSLSIRVPGYGDVSGMTTVPDTFSVTNSGAFPATVGYAPTTPPMAITWSPSLHYADYLLVVRSLDFSSPQIPKNFPGDDVPERTSMGFFMQDAHSTEISWLYLNYYGKTSISIVAMDQNYFDYLKQQMAAQGASDIREIRFNLTGAIGVFGSETVANNTVVVNVIR
jgi:hypothetical protein